MGLGGCVGVGVVVGVRVGEGVGVGVADGDDPGTHFTPIQERSWGWGLAVTCTVLLLLPDTAIKPESGSS